MRSGAFSLLVCVAQFARAQIYNGVNQLCVVDSNCTRGLSCIDYDYRSRAFKVCGCPGGSTGGINCAAPCPRSASSGTICNGQGECDFSAGTCLCNTGWKGANCTVECPGGSSTPCTLQGDCVADGPNRAKCECYSGFRNASCNVECRGGSTAPCSNHGVCNIDGSCTCVGGWRGVACNSECAGGALNPCSGHGECLPDASCSCSPLYRGSSCCMRCPDLLGVACAGRGICVPPDNAACDGTNPNNNMAQCRCNRGFRGVSCDVECYGGASNPCSGNGVCGVDGNCTCNSGWVGLACQIPCPGPPSNPCSGHGSCVGLNGTACFDGCFLADASTAACNCQSGLQGLVGSYEGAGCEVAVVNPLRRVASYAVREPHALVYLRVTGASKSSFNAAQQALFLRVMSSVLGVATSPVMLDSVQDIRGPADATTNQVGMRVSVWVGASSNQEAQNLVGVITTAVRDGALTQAVMDEGLPSWTLQLDGTPLAFSSLRDDIFPTPASMVVLAAPGTLVFTVLVVFISRFVIDRQKRKEAAKQEFNREIASLANAGS